MIKELVISNYVKSGKDRIAGWLARPDAEIISELLAFQNKKSLGGAVVEIGVHHGKSFILLALHNHFRQCYVIDIFGNQKLNTDLSGKGEKDIFLKNMSQYCPNKEHIHIDERLSSEVSSDDINKKVGKVRFFHIDGGHHFKAITADLILAEHSISEYGIVAVDDVFRPEWPEVSIGCLSYIYGGKSSLVPFAIGFNKTYFCLPGYAEEYRNAILGSHFLRMFLRKQYKIFAEEVLVLQQYPLPEWGMRKRIFNYLKTYHPDFAFRLWSIQMWPRKFGQYIKGGPTQLRP